MDIGGCRRCRNTACKATDAKLQMQTSPGFFIRTKAQPTRWFPAVLERSTGSGSSGASLTPLGYNKSRYPA